MPSFGDRAGDRTELRVGKVALVHDYLNQRGGAERVVLEMSDMWPDAPVLYVALSTRFDFCTLR